MRLLLASSADGYLARGPEDDMTWTGRVDKALFRLLTLSGGTGAPDTVLVGSRTFDQMPKLPGRDMVRLSNDGLPGSMTLEQAAAHHPRAWLIGGPTVAIEALRRGLVDRAFICVSPVTLGEGMYAAELEAYLPAEPAHSIKVGDVRVLLFNEDQLWRGR